MSDSKKIFELLPIIAKEVGAIGKDQKMQGTGGNYNYRGLDDVVNAVGPVLAKHGVFMRCEVLRDERGEKTSSSGKALLSCRLHLRYFFVASDGSEICTDAIGESLDSGDKASNKAMSLGYKNAICQALCLPYGDDGDAENHEVQPQRQPTRQLDEHRSSMDRRHPDAKPSEKQIKRLFAIAHTEGWSNDDVKLAMHEKFGAESTSALTVGQIDDLIIDIQAAKNPTAADDILF